MRIWKQLLQVTTLAVLASACGTSSSTSVTAPSARCAVSATAQPAAVGAPGGSGSIVISTDRECAWEARSESDWLAISDSSGRGDGSLRYTAAGNPVVSERRGSVVVNGLRVEIGQAAATCTFGLDRSQQSVPAAGGRVDVTVSAQGGCAWTARSDAPWIAITSGAAGQGSGAVSFTVSPNTTAQLRSSVVTIAGQPYLVEQAGAPIADPNPAPPADPNCAFSVSPLASSVGAEGGTIEVRVTASAATCTWTAASAAPWIVMEGGVGEIGSGARRFIVAANATSASRVGTLGIAGVNVTVTQAAGSAPPAPPPAPDPTPTPPNPPPPTPTPCTFSVAPLSATAPAEGGMAAVAVTASASDCQWTAAPGAAWLTIQGAAGGTGSGRVRIAAAANPDTSARSGVVTVAGAAVTITQAAAAAPPPPPTPTCNYAVAPNPVTVRFSGDNDVDLHVVTTDGCAWTATSQASWITIDRGGTGSGDGHVHIAVAASLSISGRVGTVSIAGQTVTVNQGGILNEEVIVSGTVSGLSGSCPNRTFVIAGVTVVTNAQTEFPGRNECTGLVNGTSARVRGIGQADGSILANRVDRIGEGALELP